MRAGSLKQRVRVCSLIETQSTGATGTGEMIQSWSTGTELWANVEPLRGREYFSARQYQSIVDTRITLRYTTLIDSKSKIIVNGVDYFVESSIDVGLTGTELQCMCYRVQP